MINRPSSAREDWVQQSAAGVTLWVPPDWERMEAPGMDLVLLGPQEPYRANLSVTRSPLPAPTTLDLVVFATAESQRQSLTDFLEYERRPTDLAGTSAMHRQYAWYEDQLGLVLYQHQILALSPVQSQGGSPAPAAGTPGAGGSIVQVHLTSNAPSYFRFAATFQRIIESLSA